MVKLEKLINLMMHPSTPEGEILATRSLLIKLLEKENKKLGVEGYFNDNISELERLKHINNELIKDVKDYKTMLSVANSMCTLLTREKEELNSKVNDILEKNNMFKFILIIMIILFFCSLFMGVYS